MRASKRLNAILKLIDEPSKVIADIGCDHGELAKLLIVGGKAKKVIATDISALSLEKTKKLVEHHNLGEKVETRVGDGLEPFEKGEIQIAVIAGMGGREIAKILSSNQDDGIERFILQPIQNVVNLREYLIDNNYIILKDFIVKDKNKFYNTIETRKKLPGEKQVLSKQEIEFGLTNFDLPNDFAVYLRAEKKRLTDILETNKSEKLEKRLMQVESLLKENNNARNNKVSRD